MEDPNIDNLNINEDDTNLERSINQNPNNSFNPTLCLVGRFLKNKAIRIHIMKQRLSNICHPLQGVTLQIFGLTLSLSSSITMWISKRCLRESQNSLEVRNEGRQSNNGVVDTVIKTNDEGDKKWYDLMVEDFKNQNLIASKLMQQLFNNDDTINDAMNAEEHNDTGLTVGEKRDD
ncbi:hypothetical protein JHK85_044370 [Glycine max]|nr:hypothetical protein JHK85_044370 [Glycine max]